MAWILVASLLPKIKGLMQAVLAYFLPIFCLFLPLENSWA
jgi:hypothetical protein